MVRYELGTEEIGKAVKMRLKPEDGVMYIEAHDGDDWVRIGLYGLCGIFESIGILNISIVKLERLGLSINNGRVRVQ